MPGVVVFKRRWSVGSDDFVVPGIFLLLLHTIWEQWGVSVSEAIANIGRPSCPQCGPSRIQDGRLYPLAPWSPGS
ncbi:hypothetical protein MRX96_024203 [Rhipicephalus microplus]